jgi:uncharacterized membrane protein YGL010W
MKPLIKQLSNYASYHRDQRNIATHFIGVPMIVLSVISFLSRPGFDVGGLTVTPMWLAGVAVAAFYLRLDLRYGLTMSALLGLGAVVATSIAAQTTAVWLAVSAGLFIVGWVIQFVGHYFEGKKPAFADDLIGLIIGPLFVTAELGFIVGLRAEVKAEIEKISGPTWVRPLGTPAQPPVARP